MTDTTLHRFAVTIRGHVFLISARSERAALDALDTIQAYARTLIPVV